MKDRCLHFQLKWLNYCSPLVLERTQDFAAAMGLHPSDLLADKVVSLQAQ